MDAKLLADRGGVANRFATAVDLNNAGISDALPQILVRCPDGNFLHPFVGGREMRGRGERVVGFEFYHRPNDDAHGGERFLERMKLRAQGTLDTGTSLVARPKPVAERLDHVVGGDTDVGIAALDHLEHTVQNADYGAIRAVHSFVEPALSVEVTEELVCAVDDVNDHARRKLNARLCLNSRTRAVSTLGFRVSVQRQRGRTQCKREADWIMNSTNVEESAGATCCPVVELRQYTLQPGMRDQLIELFEREFVESQEEVGMRIVGTFRDLENPERFVWLRGFQDMESRADQLARFYGGRVWKAHRDAANATMIDSDNVLLLRPVTAQSGFNLALRTHADDNTAKTGAAIIVATIYHLRGDAGEFAQLFDQHVAARRREAAIPILASFISEHHRNTFPALPVREDANVFVWFTQVTDRAEYERRAETEQVPHKIQARIVGQPEVLLLAPTARSLLRA